MTNGIKTKANTSYYIEKWTENIIEITSCNGYMTTNIVHRTKWTEDPQEKLKEFESKLL